MPGFFVCTSLCMLWGWFILASNWGDVCTVRRVCNLLLLSQLFRSGLLLCFLEISFSPINLRLGFCFLRDFGLLHNLQSLFLCLVCLSCSNLFVLLLWVAVKFARPLVTSLAHFLTHYLTESTVIASVVKRTLRRLQCFLFSFNLKLSNGRFFVIARRGRLPLYRMQFFEHFSFSKNSFAARCENIDDVVNFHSFIQNTCHEMNSIRSPLNPNATIWLCFSNLSQILECPKVDLSCQISKAANHSNLRKGTYSNCVSVSLTKLKNRIAILVVKCCCRWLNTRYYDEAFAAWYPSNILYHIVKNRNKLAITSSKNLDIL